MCSVDGLWKSSFSLFLFLFLSLSNTHGGKPTHANPSREIIISCSEDDCSKNRDYGGLPYAEICAKKTKKPEATCVEKRKDNQAVEGQWKWGWHGTTHGGQQYIPQRDFTREKKKDRGCRSFIAVPVTTTTSWSVSYAEIYAKTRNVYPNMWR